MQDHVLQIARVGRGMCALPDLYRVKHDSRLPFRLETARAFAVQCVCAPAPRQLSCRREH
jgi:hypothetical protein